MQSVAKLMEDQQGGLVADDRNQDKRLDTYQKWYAYLFVVRQVFTEDARYAVPSRHGTFDIQRLNR